MRKRRRRQKAILQKYLDDCEKAQRELEAKKNAHKAKQESLKRQREQKMWKSIVSPASTPSFDKTVVDSTRDGNRRKV